MSIYFNKHKNKFKLWPLSWSLIKIGIFAHLIKSYINHNKIIIKSIETLRQFIERLTSKGSKKFKKKSFGS